MVKRRRTTGSRSAPARKIPKLGNLLDIVATGEEESKEQAEQDIQKLAATKTYTIQLVEHLTDQNCVVKVRILAADKLKNIVETQWCSTAKKFSPPEIDPKNKEKIKSLLIAGLSEADKEVQKAVADIITTIIQWDWPDKWAGLIETLITHLHGDKESGVQGGLLILKKINLKRSKPDGPNNTVVVADEMNRIFSAESQYSVETRCLALDVLSQIVTCLSRTLHQELLQDHLKSAISLFCKTSILSWKSENGNEKLKTNILKVIVMLIKHSPKYIGDYLANMLPLFWQTLTDSVENYRANIVNRIGTGEADNSLGDLIRAMLEFIRHLAGGKQMYCLVFPDYELADYEWTHLQDSFIPPQALRCLITLMEITDDQVQLWKTDVEDLVRREFWIFPNDGIRRAAEDLIEFVMEKKRTMASGLYMVIKQYLQGRPAEIAKRVKDQPGVGESSWKPHEALLLAFGLIKEYIMPEKAGGSPRFNVAYVFKNIIFAELNNPASHPLLVGRCLCLGGTYGDLIPTEMASILLKATANRLRENQPASVRICAAKAVYLWYDRASSKENDKNEKIRRSNIPALFEGLLSVAKDIGSDRVVKLILKSVAALMPVDKTFTASEASRIYSLIEKALPEYCTVSMKEHPCLSVLEKLSMNSGCVELLGERLIPTLLHMMTSAPSDRPNTGNAAVEITEVLVKHSSVPQSNLLTGTLLPAFCNFLVKAENSSNLSRGIDVLQAFLTKPFHKVIMQRDKDGRYSAQHIPQVIVIALDKKCQVKKACKILISLIQGGWPEGGESIDELLKALLSYIRASKSSYDNKEALLVFAHLIKTQPNIVLNFLASVPSPDGEKSALELVLCDGLCKTCFWGSEDKAAFKLALGKILEYAVSDLSSQLHKITLKDGYQPTTTPLLVKIWNMATR